MSVLNQVINSVGILALKYIDTGDRMLDNSLNLIVTTSLAFLSTWIVAFWLEKRWKRWINFILRRPWNPTDFDICSMPVLEPDTIFTFSNHPGYEIKQKICEWILKTYSDFPLGVINQCNKKGHIEYGGNGKLFPIYQYAPNKYVYINVTINGCRLGCESRINLNRFLDLFQSKNQKLEGLLIFNYKPTKDGADTTTERINTRKTLDTIFFDQKSQLVNLLTKFKNKTLYPRHLPIDNSLGILLSGPPGTGKTGTAIAIANFLNKDIVNVDLRTVKTCQQFDEILKYSEGKILFLDEVDTIIGVIKHRDGSVSEDSDTGHAKYLEKLSLLMNCKDETMATKIREEITTDRDNVKLNLGYLLTKLDGLSSKDGRIIIATTNHPEHIDSALLRPGRFDLKLTLDRCSHQMLQDILSFFYRVPVTREQIQHVKEKSITPMELINLCLQFPLEEVLAKL